MKRMFTVTVVAVCLLLVGAPMSWAEHPSESLVRVSGSDVSIASTVIGMIPDFDPNKPIYAACDNNGWFVLGKGYTSPTILSKTKLIRLKSGRYLAKGLAGKRFHPVQMSNLDNTDPNVVGWAKIENLPGVNIEAGDLPTWFDISGGKNKPCIRAK